MDRGGCSEAKRILRSWGRNNAFALQSLRILQEKVFRICLVTWHDGNQVPNARIDIARLTLTCFARGQTIETCQILVSRHAVENGEAVSELDVDLVVAEAPEVVVHRLAHALVTSR